jgi:UDP-N-acetylglucosamine diphosphorylase/glucosamine-1-phosphate N-acetyltransferase
MRICLFEDPGVADLEPLVLTRPVFELLCGLDSLRAKQLRQFPPGEVGLLVRPFLANLCRRQYPNLPVNDLAWLRAEPAVLVNGRWLPSPEPPPLVESPHVALIDDEVAYAVLGPDQLVGCSSNTLVDCLESCKNTLPHRQADGCLVRFPWELIEHNAEQLRSDFQCLTPGQVPIPPDGFALVGPAAWLLVNPTAQVDPLVLADTTRGPVVIDREVVVTAFSRLEGPCYIGPGTHVLGAKIRGGTTLGPNCRIGGEVEASIVHGHTNKCHDGFLGHSYVGEWVNFGAGTQNSDLRNDYGEVRVTINGRLVATGLTKVGCFIGDHTKTGLGTLLNTGTHVGVFCNLLPAGHLLPKYLPSFCSWWNGALVENSGLPRLLETAAEVMQRRGATLTEVHAAVLRHLFDQSAPARYAALRQTEQPRLRRSA